MLSSSQELARLEALGRLAEAINAVVAAIGANSKGAAFLAETTRCVFDREGAASAAEVLASDMRRFGGGAPLAAKVAAYRAIARLREAAARDW